MTNREIATDWIRSLRWYDYLIIGLNLLAAIASLAATHYSSAISAFVVAFMYAVITFQRMIIDITIEDLEYYETETRL